MISTPQIRLSTRSMPARTARDPSGAPVTIKAQEAVRAGAAPTATGPDDHEQEAVTAMHSVAPSPDTEHPDACPECLDNLELPYFWRIVSTKYGRSLIAYYGCRACGHSWRTGWAA